MKIAQIIFYLKNFYLVSEFCGLILLMGKINTSLFVARYVGFKDLLFKNFLEFFKKKVCFD